jgi:hypothetical protein
MLLFYFFSLLQKFKIYSYASLLKHPSKFCTQAPVDLGKNKDPIYVKGIIGTCFSPIFRRPSLEVMLVLPGYFPFACFKRSEPLDFYYIDPPGISDLLSLIGSCFSLLWQVLLVEWPLLSLPPSQ